MNSGVLKLSWRTSTTWRSVRPLNVAGSSSRKPPKSASSNFLNGANCQSRGPSLSPSSVTPELRNRSIEFAGFLQHAAVGDEPRSLDGEHEAVRHLARPFAEGRRRLRAVERAVDLDRGQALAGVGEFLRVRQALRIEHAAPRLEGPAADPNADMAFRGHAHVTWLWHTVAQVVTESIKFRRQSGHDERVTPDERAPTLNSGVLKLSWRTSTTWRSFRPSNFRAAVRGRRRNGPGRIS